MFLNELQYSKAVLRSVKLPDGLQSFYLTVSNYPPRAAIVPSIAVRSLKRSFVELARAGRISKGPKDHFCGFSCGAHF
jgi:hypothetical protein